MISYAFDFEDGGRLRFEVDECSDTSVERPGAVLPDWVLLDNHRCEDCPLPPGSRQSCPAGLAIQPVVEAFDHRISFEKVAVTVTINDVQVSASMSTQRALRSLIGLLFALSACPVLSKLRPMARFHQPFVTRKHTTFRFLGMHLIAQYLRAEDGRTVDHDLAELRQLFHQIHLVNKGLANRIRAAGARDATVNSLIILDVLADSAELDVQRRLEELRPLFAPYLTE